MGGWVETDVTRPQHACIVQSGAFDRPPVAPLARSGLGQAARSEGRAACRSCVGAGPPSLHPKYMYWMGPRPGPREGTTLERRRWRGEIRIGRSAPRRCILPGGLMSPPANEPAVGQGSGGDDVLWKFCLVRVLCGSLA